MSILLCAAYMRNTRAMASREPFDYHVRIYAAPRHISSSFLYRLLPRPAALPPVISGLHYYA